MAYNPFAAIREFWGEDLSPELIDRMVRAPKDHYGAFSDEYLARTQGLGPLPALAAAHTRPIAATSSK